MQTTDAQNPYEVYCYECNVTAPPETRKCVHCGNRLSDRRSQPKALSALSDFFDAEAAPHDDAPRMGGISPVTIVWVLIFIVGSLYRLCN